MTAFVEVATTTAEKADAQKIANELVQRRLAACVQICGPVESTYWWNGKVESATEWRLAIKTRRSLFTEVENAIRELHPYEVPEILATAIELASDSYLRWLGEQLRESP